MKVIAEQGDTVDSLCWRYYGRTQSVVEQVYAANVGLAAAGGNIAPWLRGGAAGHNPGRSQ